MPVDPYDQLVMSGWDSGCAESLTHSVKQMVETEDQPEDWDKMDWTEFLWEVQIGPPQPAIVKAPAPYVPDTEDNEEQKEPDEVSLLSFFFQTKQRAHP